MYFIMDTQPKTGRGESWVAVQIVLLLAILVCPSWPANLGGLVSMLIGVLIGVVGLIIVILSASSLGSTLSVFPRPLDDGRLTQTGLYALVRHPIYCGVILSALGWVIFRASIPALVLTLILAIFFDRKAAREEIWLMQKYTEYGTYRQRVHKLIPFIY
jgi:protein-S-isoprenylcysteine O-methyltransferase Ste14